MSYNDDHHQGYDDGSKYRFPEKMTQSYINGWWEGKEDRDSEDYNKFIEYDMENENEE